tara:strand:- start:1573 stop:2160 length:588 start_codon:yes stop_codon:yes gene_type:complete
MTIPNNLQEIREHMRDIFNEALLEEFIDDLEEMCNIFDNRQELYDWIDQRFIQQVFNNPLNTMNILEKYDKDYTLDLHTFINMTIYVKMELVDISMEEEFLDLFTDELSNNDIKSTIINLYALYYIQQDWDFGIDFPIVRLLRNCSKYNYHKNKHSGLINLYTKLDIKTKQKKTISRILNNKFDMDILQNILDCY